MRNGIVMEIKDGKASVMKTGGAFVKVKAQAGWKVGAVVCVPAEKGILHSRVLGAVAACFLALCSVSLFGYRTYYHESSIISLDVNPSIEIKSNRFDRVISVTSYNGEGERILEQSDIKNKKLDDALTELFAGRLSEYVTGNDYVTLTVQSDNKQKEIMLLRQLQDMAGQLVMEMNQTADVEVYAVDRDTVSDAHSHHVTAGKYVALLQLQQIRPQMDIEEYAGCGIGEIKQQIKNCEEKHGNTPSESHERDNSHNNSSHGHGGRHR